MTYREPDLETRNASLVWENELLRKKCDALESLRKAEEVSKPMALWTKFLGGVVVSGLLAGITGQFQLLQITNALVGIATLFFVCLVAVVLESSKK
jgi:uncharacterized membrane protein YoaK (UPF0700 family)